MEEASHGNEDNFKLNIVPIMQLSYTTLMAIATAEGERNLYTRLMNMKKLDGTSLFRVVDAGLVCPKCIAAETAADCTHMRHVVAGWKSVQRMEIFRQVMKDDPEKYAREVLGASVTSEKFVFDKDLVDAAMNAEPVKHLGFVDALWLAIDPSGGGSSSDYAIVTIAMIDGCIVVLGIDAEASSRDSDIVGLILDHISAIRAIPQLEDVHIFVIPEANMSFISTDRIATIIDDASCGPASVVPYIRPDGKRDPRGRYGVITSESRKVLYVNEIKALLQRGNLRFFNCSAMAGRHARRDKAALAVQLKNYKQEIIPGDEYGARAARKRYSGKGAGEKDDICLVIQIAVYWRMVYAKIFQCAS